MLRIFKDFRLRAAGVLLLILLAVFLVWFGRANSSQAVSATPAQVYFEGEYRIAYGPWLPIEEGGHISSTKGDVTLRGYFHLLSPDGEDLGLLTGGAPIAFYTDHIGLTFFGASGNPYTADHENPAIGESACGVDFTIHYVVPNGTEPIEILVNNPHAYGNESAIDEMLSSVAIYSGTDFEKEILEAGESQRSAGILLMTVSLVFLGTALFSALIHAKNNRIIWLLGLVVLFAGLYLAYSADGVSFWRESVIANTTVLGLSMMLYMLFLLMSIVFFLKRTKGVGSFTVLLLAVANAVFFLLPIVSDIFFYDTWLPWVVVQAVANAVLSVCLFREFLAEQGRKRWIYLGAILPLAAFAVDAIAVGLGAFDGALVSRHVFTVFLAVATVVILKLIPRSINAATRAKTLEVEKIVLGAQLAESRISTMMSQIRPHFIYNTLGSIEQLCKLDPPKAGELVHNFSKYLRGNFGELDNPKPIRMSQEMEHVRHYISIENVRFPDMTFTFEMNSDDFSIPALTVQPIVENAIKHGLMKLQKGGTIRVVSYETDTHYCVLVQDDGVGFDTGVLQDERGHVGIRNIRERLKVMVGGTLEIESREGAGTKVLIKIPKEDGR